MPYTPTLWKNREVERPRTFKIQNNPDGTVTLLPSEGNIIETGTPIIAANMNKIEQGIVDAQAALENVAPKNHTHDAKDIVSGIMDAARLPLLDAVNSTSTQHAATANSVKIAYDEAQAAKQSGVDAKQRTVDAINAMGGSASTSDSWATLAAKIRAIQTGVKMAKGITPSRSQSVSPFMVVEVRGLTFRPQCIAINNGIESRLYGEPTTYPGASGLNKYILDNKGGYTEPNVWDIYDDGFRAEVTLKASSSDYNWVAFGG